MNHKKLYPILFTVMAALFLFFSACEDNVYRINSKKLLQEEQDLLSEYLELHEDSLAEAAVGIIDKRLESGLILFRMEEGTGDSVTIGKQVGFRFTLYRLARDTMEVPALFLSGSNLGDLEPVIYQAGSVTPLSGGGGLDEGIRFMRWGEKAKMILPSTIWNGSRNDFATRVIDVEVTYLER